MASTSALLKNDHQRLLLRLADVRRGFEESGCSLYLLVKIGVFAEAWNDYDEQDGSVLREMVQERLERLARYLKEDLEDAEEQMKEAETECLERVLRPAGLELSLLF